MSAPSDPRTLVLHGLRLKGFADAGEVAEAVSLPEAEAADLLASLADQNLCVAREARRPGWALTPRGRAEHARLLAEELDRAGAREALQDTYRRFLVLNPQLLDICTDWQLRQVDGATAVNDHQDPIHDAAVIDRLRALHADALPVCNALAALLGRYAHYGPRLQAALDRVLAGDVDWFTKPMIPSYHTVWFELHEDLLATLGIERGSEVPA